MSFDLAFCKDHLINKLAGAKDRVAAALKTLDGCDVKLRTSTTTSKHDNKMPSKIRSMLKHKHSFEAEHEHTHTPHRYYYDSLSASDSDSDCDCACPVCNGVYGPRGRSLQRGSPIIIDGSNASQQNIQVQGCRRGGACQRSRRRHRSHSRPRFIISAEPSCRHNDNSTSHVIQNPRHYDDRCCIHGFGHFDFCTYCPSSHRIWPDLGFQNFIPVVGDDGNVVLIEPNRIHKRFFDHMEAAEKVKKDKKEADEKEEQRLYELMKKLHCKPNPYTAWSPLQIPRSADEIRKELAKANADIEQLRMNALVSAQITAARNQYFVNDSEDRLMVPPLASGALQAETCMSKGARPAHGEKQAGPCPTQLRSILAGPGAKGKKGRVNWGSNEVRRIVEVDDEKCDCASCL